MGGGFQIVEQLHVGNVEPLREHTSIDDPGKISRAAAVIDNRPRHAEAGRRQCDRLGRQLRFFRDLSVTLHARRGPH